MVAGERDAGLALPGLSSDDALARAHGVGDAPQQTGEVLGCDGVEREVLKGGHDQGVAGEHGEGLAVGGVHRGAAAAFRGVIEAGEVVVDERGAVQELEGARGGPGTGGVTPARLGDREAERRTQTGSASEGRVPHRRGQAGRDGRSTGQPIEILGEGGFNLQRCRH